MHHQCFINAFINASSMHRQCICQCIINTFINAFSDQYTMHQCIIIASNTSILFIQFFLSFIKFIQISSFALLFVYSLLCCCHPFRHSSFLFKFTLPIQFIFQAFICSFAVRSCIQSSTIISFLCLANS